MEELQQKSKKVEKSRDKKKKKECGVRVHSRLGCRYEQEGASPSTSLGERGCGCRGRAVSATVVLSSRAHVTIALPPLPLPPVTPGLLFHNQKSPFCVGCFWGAELFTFFSGFLPSGYLAFQGRHWVDYPDYR